MRAGPWTSACCMAVLIGGCPKRQSGPRLVYVAPPPAATSAGSAADSGTWVIEEPAPPEETIHTSEAPPPTPPPPLKSPKPRPTGVAAEPPSTEREEPSSVEPPPLEPADSAGGRDRQTIETTQKRLSDRLDEFEHRRPLSDAERRTLGEARAFLEQSRRALNDHDLRRAENLAHKADLLITALEQRH